MARFDSSLFDMGNHWVEAYEDEEDERYVTYNGRFIARFKYANPGECAEHFVKFLIENFEIEEYFALRENGTGSLTPMLALETKGFIDYNTLQAMKRGGFATREEMLADTRKRYGLFVD